MEAVAGAEDVVVVVGMVAEEEGGDGECFCVKFYCIWLSLDHLSTV